MRKSVSAQAEVGKPGGIRTGPKESRILFKFSPGLDIYTYVRLLLGFLSLASVLVGGGSVQAAHTQARLLLAADTARAGETVMAGIELRMEPHWHTYWRNSGGSGAPTTIEWELPKGVTAGEIQWPVPEKLPAEELTTYIYENEVVLLVPLKL